MTKINVCCLILCFRLWGLVGADHVPVLIWGSHIRYEPAHALQFRSGDDFIDVLIGALTSDTVTIVITEDQLTVEDLTQCRTENGSCFQGIRQIKDKLYLPNVEDPVPAMEDFAGTDKVEVNILPNGSLSKSLNDNLQSYVFINFEDNIDDERTTTKLTHHDQLIAKLYSELLSENQRLLVIFTGKRAGTRGRSIREISDSQPTTTVGGDNKNVSGVFWKRDQLLLFYTSFHVVDALRNQSMLFDKVSATDVDRSAQMVVTMTVTESDDYFVFKIVGKNGYWWLNESTWNAEELFPNRQISALNNFSFHCTPSIELATVNRTVVISWKGLQLQPNFNSTVGQPLKRFDDAWDCVHFFSPAIMGGLFVGCMLLFFLFIGILCIMDINTNDRFEKTSQKQLTFSVSE